MTTLFISYSRKDTDFVRRLYDALASESLESWVDWEGIPPADDWLRKIHAAIEGADAFVFVMSPDSLDSRVCGDEIAHAVKHNKRLIPVVWRDPDATRERAPEPPEILKRLNWIFLRGSDDFGAGLGKLISAIRTDLEWVAAHTRLLQRAIEWEANRKDESFLLQKNDLSSAEQWLVRGPDKDPKPTALQSDYIVASRAAATRRQRRLTAAAVVAAVLVGIGAIVATVQYVTAEIRREEGLSRQLAAQSAASVRIAPELGLLLAVHAHDIAPTFEATSAMVSALEHVRGVSAFVPGRYVPGTLAFSADGSLMAVGRCQAEDADACMQPSVDVWQLPQLKRLASLPVDLDVWRLAFSADGKRLAVALCCKPDDTEARTGHSLIVELPASRTDATSTPLKTLPAQPFELGSNPNPAERLAHPDVVTAADQAVARAQRAAGATGKSFLAVPAVEGDARRVLAISGTDLYSPARVDLWDVSGPPRRLTSATLKSFFFDGGTSLRADGKLAAAYGCGVMASARICDRAELLVVDDTGSAPRTGIVFHDQPDWVRAVAVAPKGPFVFSGGCGKYAYQNCQYGELRLWQAQEGEDTPRAYEPLQAFGGAVESIATSADGRFMGLISQRGKLVLYDLASLQDADTAWLASPLVAGRSQPAQARKPAFACGDGPIEDPVLTQAAAHLTSPATLCAVLAGTAIKSSGRASEAYSVAALSETGARLAVGACTSMSDADGSCQRGQVTIWTLGGQAPEQAAIVDTQAEPTALALTPDGKMLAVATCSHAAIGECEDGKVELVDLARSGHPRQTLGEGLLRVSAMSVDSKGAVLAYAGCARLEDTGAVRGCGLGALTLHGLSSAAPMHAVLTPERGTIDHLAFSPDAARLVSGGPEGITFWDPERGERIGPTIAANATGIEDLRFAADDLFVTASSDEQIEWHASPARWQRAACRIANRSLTQTEHLRFLGPQEAVRNPCAESAGERGSWFWRWLRSIAARG
ncbi:MAG: toll/interleukin-1 receptor domain-containing protein [Betaproteobacteria bacterium]|nr:MAG: toll/interleukin-1 receptor domain-containing protein [Betaproteobacteria bacterium]